MNADDISTDKKLFRHVKSIFLESTRPTIEEISPAPEGKKQPIFIVGMHRSGTTLVEQILSSHSQASGEDEVLTMDRIARPIIANNSNVHSGGLTEDTIRHIRDDYLSELEKFGTGEPCITDKMPLSFRWIGFILTAMPEARIINIQRDSVATCWSVFKQYISNNAVGYAYDLADIAEYYKLYIELTDFWEEIFPGQIYGLNYESLTKNPSAASRKRLEYCNLGWEAQCLEIHKTPRAVRTPSSAQVRQAIYKGSAESWRKYQTHLQPLLQELAGYVRRSCAADAQQHLPARPSPR